MLRNIINSFLTASKLLKISKSSFTILSGDTDRYKKISIDIPPSEIISSHLTKLGEIQ